MPASVDRSKYHNTHLKNPRGYGHWVFKFRPGSGDFHFTGVFGDALKAAQKQASKRGAYRVIVMP